MTWLPIETAPRDRTIVLLLEKPQCDGGIIHASSSYIGYWADLGMYDSAGREGWINFWSSDPDEEFWDEYQPTHWMPLPVAPE